MPAAQWNVAKYTVKYSVYLDIVLSAFNCKIPAAVKKFKKIYQTRALLLCARLYICIHIFTCVYVYIPMFIYVYSCTCTCIHTDARTAALVRAYMCI